MSTTFTRTCQLPQTLNTTQYVSDACIVLCGVFLWQRKFKWGRHGSEGLSRDSQRGGPDNSWVITCRICGEQSGTETRFSESFCFYLSASFYHCSTLIFIYTFLLPVGQKDARNFPKSDLFKSKLEKRWIENYLNIFQSSKNSYICFFFGEEGEIIRQLNYY